MNQLPPPIPHPPAADWVLLVVAAVLFLWGGIRSWRRRRKPPAPQYHLVSWRVLWWRKAAPRAAVRRELAPLAVQLHDTNIGRIAELFPDDAEEDDHAYA